MNDVGRQVLRLVDEAADEVAQLHAGAQLAFVGMLGVALDGLEPLSSAERSRLASAGAKRADVYNQSIERLVERTTLDLLNLGRVHAGGLDDTAFKKLKDLATPAVQQTLERVALGLAADVETVNKVFRNFQFEATMLMQAGKSRSSAVMRAKQGKVWGISFERPDRAGKLWSSNRMSKLASRGLFLTAYVEAYVYTRSAQGEDLAYIDYEDPAHANHAEAFSILGTTAGLRAYNDIRDGIWHPNARVLVSHVSP